MADKNRLSLWNNMWDQGMTGWHLQNVNPLVVNFAEKFLTAPNRRVFVPLCGKTVDMKWLYDQGHTVIGVDAVETAVLDFAAEQKIEMQKEEISLGVRYKTADNRLQIYICDLFTVTPEIVGKFDAMWDRGSLVAIYEYDREKYAKLMLSLMKPQFRILVDVLEYIPTAEFAGPPRSVPVDLCKKLYDCEQQELYREDVTAIFEERGKKMNKMEEIVLLLSEKQ